MIPFTFDYYRPETIHEAVRAFRKLDQEGKEPLYYGGGSEIISMARLNNIHTGAVIDLKAIPECNVLALQGNLLVIGSCVTLSRISESKLFPLLEKTAGRIADHTMQCRITIGGNIAGTIIYREMVLPLLLVESRVILANGGRPGELPLQGVFKERLTLSRGDFIVQFLIEKEYLSLPYVHVKKTRNEKIDYPLITVAALKKDNIIRLALGGVCRFPFRSSQVEKDLNAAGILWEERAASLLSHLPAPILDDVSGSADYRRFVLKNTLRNTAEELEGLQ